MSKPKEKPEEKSEPAPAAPPAVPEVIEQHILSILVDNEPGVLARVVGLFSGRGYNIDSLTVTEVQHEQQVSRITLVTSGTPRVVGQIKAQLEKLVPVHRVVDLTSRGTYVYRELALVKIGGQGEHRTEALRIAEAFGARLVDATLDSLIFELTGRSDKVDQFVEIMRPLNLLNVCRTGVAALNRGAEKI